MKITRLITLPTAVISVVILCGCKSEKPDTKIESSEVAKDLTLTNYDGTTVSLSDYKGKIIVLEWFNYECPFVKYHYENAQTMTTLANKYKDKNVIWLAINSTGHLTIDKNKQFAEQHNVESPILDDRTGKTGRAYGARTTPHMFIIDADGKIVYEGAIDNSPLGRTKDVVNYVDKALSEMTSGKAVSIPNTEPYGCSVKYAN